MVAMTVPPVMCAQAVRERVMSMVVEASRPVLYWSSRMTRAFVTSCSPMDTRRFSPPLTPRMTSLPTMVSAQFVRPRTRSRSSTRSSVYLRTTSVSGRPALTFAFSAANINVSRTVSWGMWTSSWPT